MRHTISSAYPADDIIAIITLVACALLILLVIVYITVEAIKKRYRAKHAASWSNLIGYAEADVLMTEKLFNKYQKDVLRSQKEQDAKDQETLDRATEYHNGI